MNYYNEFDPKAAAWIRELIKLGEIPDGEVDTRSIADVQPGDLKGYTQCHFFAGIAGWSLALKFAGIGADVPLWTGSCPCQAFSTAGKRKGFNDERDLWPVFFNLIRECRPAIVLGEQVEGAVKFGWLDRLCADLEGEGYAVGSAVLGAHSAGAPHIRQRLYWGGKLADAMCNRHKRDRPQSLHGEWNHARSESSLAGCGATGRLADGECPRCEGRIQRGQDTERENINGCPGCDGSTGGLDNTVSSRFSGGEVGGFSEGRTEVGELQDGQNTTVESSYRCNWSNAVAIPCRDGVSRLIEPSVFPLVAGLPRGVGYSGDPSLPEYANNTQEGRQMRLKGYGNAIVPQVAAMFIEAFMEDYI